MPLDLAVDAEHSNVYDALGLGDRLLQAAAVGDVRLVRDCVTRGVGVNGKDQNGWTALHRVAFVGQIEVVKVLIGNGARPDVTDNVDLTPLRCAVEAGHVEVALLLVRAQARLKRNKVGAKLFSTKLDSCGADVFSLISFDSRGIQT